MEKFNLENDIPVLRKKAASFPGDILNAHQSLHALLPFWEERRYFGISRPEDGSIVYYAAAEALEAGEAEKLNCGPFIIPKGAYISIVIKDFMKNVSGIGKAFETLTAYPDIDPQGYCIEWYLNDRDVRCMIKLRS